VWWRRCCCPARRCHTITASSLSSCSQNQGICWPTLALGLAPQKACHVCACRTLPARKWRSPRCALAWPSPCFLFLTCPCQARPQIPNLPAACSQGFEKTGLGERLANLFVRALGKSSLGLAIGLNVAECLLAPAMPSTSARAGGCAARGDQPHSCKR